MSKNAWIGLVAAVLAAAIIAGGIWLFFLRPGANPAAPTATPTASSAPSATPSAPATRTPTASATPTPTPTPGPTRTPVTPFITTDGYDAANRTLTIGANVPGVVSDDGVCTLTAAGPGGTVQGSFPAQSTGAAMDCGQMALTSPSFGTGTWTLTVSYASARAAGTTSGYEVYIQ